MINLYNKVIGIQKSREYIEMCAAKCDLPYESFINNMTQCASSIVVPDDKKRGCLALSGGLSLVFGYDDVIWKHLYRVTGDSIYKKFL